MPLEQSEIDGVREDLEALMAQLGEEEDLPPDLDDVIARYDQRLKRLEEQWVAEREMRGKEQNLGQTIQHLEARARSIREEAQELESTPLQKSAHNLYVAAQALERTLSELSKKLLAERQAQFPEVKKQVDELGPKIENLERDYDSLMRQLDDRENEAQQEDKLHPDIRWIALCLRAAEWFLKKGLSESEFLSGRGKLLEKAKKLFALAPETLEPYLQQEFKCPIDLARDLAQRAREGKQAVRAHLQDIHHLASEGLKEKDIEGQELSLPFAMYKKWEAGDHEGFYQRLWALNLLLLHGEDVAPSIKRKVRSLLQLIHGDTPPEKETQRAYAAEARRFVLMAGNGAIRRLLEENYNELKSEVDYARLGYHLYRPDKAPPWLEDIKMAVNLPRLFDLSLNDRFEGIFERRTKRDRVRHATPFLDFGVAEDVDDLVDVPLEEFTPDWVRRLMDGDLPMVKYEEKKDEQIEVGRERTIEAQIYLLDVSGSMVDYGSRQRYRFRNAATIAAINSFSVDASTKGLKEFQNLLFWRTFGWGVGELQAVENQDQALAMLKTMLNFRPSEPNTDLHGALMTAYNDIETAKGRHRQLRDAKVVVVSDGGAGLNFDELIEAQKIEGTAVVTHVFAVEEQNPELKELSNRSGMGRAFYYFIPNAASGELVASPPYGTPEEFSPIWKEPRFDNEGQRQAFEASVGQLCKDIVEEFRMQRQRNKEQEGIRSRELNEVLTQTQWQSGTTPYELGTQNAREQEIRKAKTRRLGDVMIFMGHAVEGMGLEMNEAEAMGIIRELCISRAVLTRDMKALFKTTGSKQLQKIIVEFRRKDGPRLKEGRG